MKRILGTSGVEVSALGLGCWAIGGPHSRRGNPVGWGAVNDEESIAALRRAFDLGVNFYDTADVYGCGHSEKLIAQALGDRREQIVLATKAGYTYVEATREAPGEDGSPEYIRWACDQSLRRLGSDYIDLYQFHHGGYPLDKSEVVLEVFDDLVVQGKVRYIGWSTDDPGRAELFSQSKNCVAIQQGFNVFGGNATTLAVCERNNLASILRGPLAMGMLTGKFTNPPKLEADDIRRGWNFETGSQADAVKRVESLRDVLTSGGRTLTQGALAWLWARSHVMIPIPGFKSVAQVEENVGAMQFGPLEPELMKRVDQILGR